MEELKKKANPLYKELGELEEMTRKGHNSIVAAINKGNERVCKYKEEQKQGDIKFRRKATTQGFAGILIAMLALYISIKNYDGPLIALLGVL